MVVWEKIREDFPVLQRLIDGKNIVYFDNACYSLKPRQVVEAMNYYYHDVCACAGRAAHSLGREITDLVEESREKVQRFLNAKEPAEIIWTRNTTEGINLVANATKFGEGDEVITTNLEHHSGVLPFHKLQKKGIKLKIVEADKYGLFSIESWENAITDSTRLISIVWGSNVTGTVAPVEEICSIAHDHEAVVLADAAQYAPHHPIDVQKTGVDFVSMSVHKMCGPTGMGVLYGNLSLLEEMDTFLVGGDTVEDVLYEDGKIIPKYLPPPEKFEAGLQNYAGIIGAGATVDYLEGIGMKNIEAHDKDLTRELLRTLLSFEQVELLGPEDPNLRGPLAAFRVNGIEAAQDIGSFMDKEAGNYKIMMRAGHHCVAPFHYYLNIKPELGSVRASLYLYNTSEEIKIFEDLPSHARLSRIFKLLC